MFQKDNRCSVTISLAEGNFCHVKRLDPEDPRCPQVILTGRFEIVSNIFFKFYFFNLIKIFYCNQLIIEFFYILIYLLIYYFFNIG